jgi:hypothetical protein
LPDSDTTSSKGLLIGLVLGAPLLAFGIGGALVDADDTKPIALAAWVVGLAVAHDLVLVPTVLALGWAVRRVVPDGATRGLLRAGLVVSAGLCLVAYPLVSGFGRSEAVPSLLARDYGRGLAVYLVVVWAVIGVGIIVRRRSGPRVR